MAKILCKDLVVCCRILLTLLCWWTLCASSAISLCPHFDCLCKLLSKSFYAREMTMLKKTPDYLPVRALQYLRLALWYKTYLWIINSSTILEEETAACFKPSERLQLCRRLCTRHIFLIASNSRVQLVLIVLLSEHWIAASIQSIKCEAPSQKGTRDGHLGLTLSWLIPAFPQG